MGRNTPCSIWNTKRRTEHKDIFSRSITPNDITLHKKYRHHVQHRDQNHAHQGETHHAPHEKQQHGPNGERHHNPNNNLIIEKQPILFFQAVYRPTDRNYKIYENNGGTYLQHMYGVGILTNRTALINKKP
jgi:hypothetical protein